jgi:hydroxymethylbilane synthase
MDSWLAATQPSLRRLRKLACAAAPRNDVRGTIFPKCTTEIRSTNPDFAPSPSGLPCFPPAATGLAPRGHRLQSAKPPLVIGTRGSPLALAQAELVRDRLAAVHALAAETIALEAIRTTGDRIRDRPLTEAGGKGLFTKEIEEALFAGAVDLGVHSAKDMATFLPAGLAIAAVLPREDPRDVFIARTAKTLADLPRGARVGTASLRRQALIKRQRPDLAVVPLRGNVETRLRKLAEGEVDAIVLALAGLKRLGLAEAATAVLSIDEFLPAVGQGVIAIEARGDDGRAFALLRAINHAATAAALGAERAFLAVLEGSCRTPIAGHAAVAGGRLAFRGLIAKPDGSEVLETQRHGAVTDAARLGAEAARELKLRAGPDFFAAV